MNFLRQHYAVVNAVLFLLAWFVCVLGGNAWALPVVLGFVAFHGFFALANEWRFVAQVAVLGWFFDQILIRSEILQVVETPWWLHSLWLLLACTLNHGHKFLQKSFFGAFVFGAVAGTMAYFVGIKLATISLGVSVPVFFAVLMPSWALLMLLFVFMAKKQVQLQAL